MNRRATLPDGVSANVVVTHATGLHARPSVQLTRLAKSFAATIEIADDPAGPWRNAKSIVKVMGMKAASGTRLYLRASGRDAPDALAALHNLVASDFAEAGEPHGAA
jgi:phosphocarrier protein HPr